MVARSSRNDGDIKDYLRKEFMHHVIVGKEECNVLDALSCFDIAPASC